MTASHQPVVAHPHSWRSPWQQFTTIHTSHGFYLFKMMYQCDHSPKNGICGFLFTHPIFSIDHKNACLVSMISLPNLTILVSQSPWPPADLGYAKESSHQLPQGFCARTTKLWCDGQNLGDRLEFPCSDHFKHMYAWWF